ncbi:chromate efflux transporter [Sphingobium sufflavum]|uniref:chromate efflux transporter n=1 Tax=Sphingobium sufflavum TaxID=1129547 RepID=UPI001F44D98E|nr:chromate efflux transporter [Sphingobium sufflavum]MCE7797577.1 chromate efflux transporter [Sphingobium sufflavum]
MSGPTFQQLTRVFGRIGLLSFGGPAGQIALMHKELVDDRAWISEERFLQALNFCHLLPGPEAQQLATYIGWRLHGVRGGLVGGGLFVLPGALVMLGLSILYVQAAQLGWFAALFLGIKAAVLALVAQALIRIGKRALNSPFKYLLSALSFIALFFFDLPFPLVVLGAGALGMVVAAFAPHWLRLKVQAAPPPPSESGWVLVARTAGTVLAWLAVWSVPMVAVALALGIHHPLFAIGAFFSRLGVVTFGGAYAVLAYMAQEAVQAHHWLNAGEMADGLGLAETTPGPLIMVTQFVGFLGAYRLPAPFSPMVAGVLGAAITTWTTFAPSFLGIFACAPWIERLEHARRLQGGLAALTAAVVGVIANLAVWFGLHVLFRSVAIVRTGPLRLHVPDPGSVDGLALCLALLAFGLLFRTRIGVPGTLAICGAAAIVVRWVWA